MLEFSKESRWFLDNYSGEEGRRKKKKKEKERKEIWKVLKKKRKCKYAGPKKEPYGPD